MSEVNKLFLLMVIIGIVSIACIVGGVRYGLSEDERIKKSSKFYISVSLLIFGIMSAISFVLYMLSRFNYIKSINKITCFMLSALLVALGMFIAGIYVFLNRKKIDNQRFIDITVQGLIFSIMFISIVGYFWIKRHGFN